MKFVKPEMEKITFEEEDIIVTSGCHPDCAPDCNIVACTSDTGKSSDVSNISPLN